MIRNVEIIVERFEEGITIRWEDKDGNVDSHKSLASSYDMQRTLGNEILGDIMDAMDGSDKNMVKLNIEYTPL